MSFLTITDPTKREQKVKEYAELRNRVKDNFRRERIGESELQSDLSKFFKPVTETQKVTAREITEELKPIKEGIENLPKAIVFPSFPSIKATSEPTVEKDIQYIDNIAKTYLMSYSSKQKIADTTFGISSKENKFYLGDNAIKITGNDINVLKEDEETIDETYKGTGGLWELITLNEPNKKNYTQDDKNNYTKLLFKTKAIYRDNNPESKHVAGNEKGKKYEEIIKPIWKNRKQYEKEYLGSGVIVISSDPNALIKKLDLLLASKNAGHTNVENELVSIYDELKRQNVIDTKTYKNLNSYIKK